MLVLPVALVLLAQWSSAAPREINQERGDWRIDYAFKNTSGRGTVLVAGEVWGLVDGLVSNSRAPGHGTPRRSTAVAFGELTGGFPVYRRETLESWNRGGIACREMLALFFWEAGPGDLAGGRIADVDPGRRPATGAVAVPPGGILRIRLYLNHLHAVCGEYDPLLGDREVMLRVVAWEYEDEIPLDRERRRVSSPPWTMAVPEERRDTNYFTSPPDSLHLQAHIPGDQYFRCAEHPVRYGTKMRLRFWYLIAHGTDGACLARIAEYRDTPDSWKVLDGERHEIPLTTAGRWTREEYVFRVADEATTLALDFRIQSNTNIGEMWVDDVELVPCVPDSPADPRNP